MRSWIVRPRLGRTFFAKCQSRSVISVAAEVRDALERNLPVVALETTIYTHGLPHTESASFAARVEGIVRANGAVPATIGIYNGTATIGLSSTELATLVDRSRGGQVRKVSRRDLAFMCGVTGSGYSGGTTVAGTMVLARLAGIKVFATGGIGGVHRGAESSMDISADLTELGRTDVAVVSSGTKSFLDIGRTLEYLETQGVAVGTFADGRPGPVDYPAFWCRDSGFRSPWTVKDEKEAAAVIFAHQKLQLSSGLHFANPVSEEYSIGKEEMNQAIDMALKKATDAAASGNDVTPFILSNILDVTKGKSAFVNKKLVESNAKRAALIAKELSKLQNSAHELPSVKAFFHNKGRQLEAGLATHSSALQPKPSYSYTINAAKASPSAPKSPELAGKGPTAAKADPSRILVVGSIAMDYACDYNPSTSATPEAAPQMMTSNPASIRTSMGGVGFNIARAVRAMNATVSFHSLLGDDLEGQTVRKALDASNFNTDYIQSVSKTATARYVAVNDSQKNLFLAMSDMEVFDRSSMLANADMERIFSDSKPAWLAIDANWSAETLRKWLMTAKKLHVRCLFEPVSVAKSTRLFANLPGVTPLGVYPNNNVEVICPNQHELIAMHKSAHDSGSFDRQDWWAVINALGLPASGYRSKLTAMTSPALVDAGVPQQSIQLLPFCPTVISKLGSRGVLVTMLLSAGDERLRPTDAAAPWIIARSVTFDDNSEPGLVGGLYMRLFPPPEIVQNEEIVSVNGAGDTFVGALLAASQTRGGRLEEAIDVAQRAAILTLKSTEAVSPDLSRLKY